MVSGGEFWYSYYLRKITIRIRTSATACTPKHTHRGDTVGGFWGGVRMVEQVSQFRKNINRQTVNN